MHYFCAFYLLNEINGCMFLIKMVRVKCMF